jgi:hypothetical protein
MNWPFAKPILDRRAKRASPLPRPHMSRTPEYYRMRYQRRHWHDLGEELRKLVEGDRPAPGTVLPTHRVLVRFDVDQKKTRFDQAGSGAPPIPIPFPTRQTSCLTRLAPISSRQTPTHPQQTTRPILPRPTLPSSSRRRRPTTLTVATTGLLVFSWNQFINQKKKKK